MIACVPTSAYMCLHNFDRAPTVDSGTNGHGFTERSTTCIDVIEQLITEAANEDSFGKESESLVNSAAYLSLFLCSLELPYLS
jgi:hypothetical protein